MERIQEHPLGRVVYLIPIDSFDQTVAYIDSNTQTVAISPWHRNVEIRDVAALRGVAKITEIGLSEWQRTGSPHDGMFPMARMVRWVALDYLGKGIEYGPVDTTKWLMMSGALVEAADAVTMVTADD